MGVEDELLGHPAVEVLVALRGIVALDLKSALGTQKGYNRGTDASAEPRGWLGELGRTAIATTAISLGLAALGRPGYLTLGHGQDFEGRSVEALAARTHEVLDAAYQAGIRRTGSPRC